MLLPLPTDQRFTWLQRDQLPPPLAVLAAHIGASGKTISRIFRRETGMNYQQWRQQWRLLKAVELLANRQSITSVALDLGFASDSAFIAFFKGLTGHTPRAYILPTILGI